MAAQHPIHPYREERILAFQGLFMLDVGGLSPQEALAALRDRAKKPEVYDRAKNQFTRAVDRLPELDALIVSHLHNWSFDRLARVDRNVLRLATFELLDQLEPHSVVISEAVDIVKEYGDIKSGAFVNGVLDAIWRTVGTAGENSPQ